MSLDNPNPAEAAMASVLADLNNVVQEHFSGPTSETRLHHDLTKQMQNAGLVLRALGAAHHRTGDGCDCTLDRPLGI